MAGVGAFFVDVGKEGLHRIEVFCGEGIELMVVALRAAHGGSEEGAGSGANAFGVILGDVFLVLNTTFFRDLVDTVEGGGDVVFQGGIFEKISGELLGDKLIVGFVLVEGIDDVVAVRSDVADLVAVVAGGVGIAGEVEPEDGHALAKVWRSEKLVGV